MYSPKKRQVGISMTRKSLGERPRGSPARWPLPSEESTTIDSDAEDLGSDVSRTTSIARSSGSEVTGSKLKLKHAVSAAQDDGVSAVEDDGVEDELAACSENSIEALLEREGLDALKKRVPHDEHGNLSSVGSIPHATGACRPCVFANSERKACQNGLECLFCHLPHTPKKRMRFCKKKRMEIKRTGSAGYEQ